MPSFSDFNLLLPTLEVLSRMGITEPTPIQAEAIPALLAGKDVVGQSATGSGKTLAYSVPLVERVSKKVRDTQALILVPTRELAMQVNAVICQLATSRKLTTALVVGGRPYGPQTSALRYGAQIVVGTPGRIKDHLDRKNLTLSQLRICVLDEADQMLDSGFGPAIEEILETTPTPRQMALFSATMPDWVAKLEQKFLTDPVHITVTSGVGTGAQNTIEQIAYQVPKDQKMAALCTLLNATEGESSLIFGKTKYGVEKLGKQLDQLGFTVGTLHGNKSQRAREDTLNAFRRGQVQTLLATNVAARGLDIQGIHQVINYELPESSELFTHRSGRTGRMGRQGKAITLLVPADLPKWRRMTRDLGQNVELQKLTIDEHAMTPRELPLAPEMEAFTLSDTADPEEYTRNDRPQRVRGSQQASLAREQSNRNTGSSHSGQMAASEKRNPRQASANNRSSQRPSDHFSSEKRRNGENRGLSLTPVSGKKPRQHDTRPFVGDVSPRRSARSKSQTTRTRREGTSRRVATR